MLIACWSAKGGAGTTVVSAALALVLARRDAAGALLADLAGDLPAALGMPEPDGPGVAGWLRAGAGVPADGLARLELPVTDELALLPRGTGGLEPSRAEVLAALLAADDRPVVADCGSPPGDAAGRLVGGASRSILVTRPCFLSLRRALAAPLQPSEVVLLVEPGRALDARDVEASLGVPVTAQVPVDPAVARAVDAGLLTTRLPRGFAKVVGRAA